MVGSLFSVTVTAGERSGDLTRNIENKRGKDYLLNLLREGRLLFKKLDSMLLISEKINNFLIIKRFDILRFVAKRARFSNEIISVFLVILSHPFE